MGSWLDNVPGAGLLKSAGAITEQFGGAGGVAKGVDGVVTDATQGVDGGIAYLAGIGTEAKIQKAAELLEKVGPEGIPAGSPNTGKIIQHAVGAGVDGKVGPTTMEAVNAYFVEKFAPEPKQETPEDPNMGPAESGYVGIKNFFSDVADSVTGDDFAEDYPAIAKQIEEAIKATPEGQPVEIFKSRDDIAGPHMKFLIDRLCDKNAFDGNKELTNTIAQALGNEIAPATGNQELQAIGNSLAPELVKAPVVDAQSSITAPEQETLVAQASPTATTMDM